MKNGLSDANQITHQFLILGVAKKGAGRSRTVLIKGVQDRPGFWIGDLRSPDRNLLTGPR
jgi:hypothetical protein